ncbi:MAG: DNA primase catalytic subunit PriS [Candidatus Micrarchaeia archaeon]
MELQLRVKNPEEDYARSKFRQYYERNEIKPPEQIEKREWGFGGWEKKIEVRHLQIASKDELKSRLVRDAPLFVSYSTAYYEFPDMRPMEKKNWQGADLVFDLDSDHLEVPCKKTHGSKWVCDSCLEKVKEETVRLIEQFLIPDFGFSKKEIEVNFSGNRGYHVHVKKESVRELGGYARREIVDYLSGTGVDFEAVGFTYEMVSERRERKLVGPKPSDAGWAGRIARFVREAAVEGKLGEVGVEERDARKIYKRVGEFARLIEQGNWDAVKIQNKDKFWRGVVGRLGVKLGDRIDQNVTADATKLIRLPDSLHGESGLVARRVGSIDSFDPLKDAVVFGEQPVRIKIRNAPEFRLGEQTFGPFRNEERELPERAALFLICKKEAVLWKS